MKSNCPVCGEGFEVLRRRRKYPVCRKAGCIKRRGRLERSGGWGKFLKQRRAEGWTPEGEPVVSGVAALVRWKTRALELATCESLGEEGYRAVIPGVKGCSGVGPKPGVAMSRLIEGLDGWVEMMQERGVELPVLG